MKRLSTTLILISAVFVTAMATANVTPSTSSTHSFCEGSEGHGGGKVGKKDSEGHGGGKGRGTDTLHQLRQM